MARFDTRTRFDDAMFESLVSRVKEVGDENDIENWRKAFPDAEFFDVDDGFTGERINWNEWSLVEKALYVAYMNDPQAVQVEYSLDVDGHTIKHEIRDSERFWWLWMAGAFVGVLDGIQNLSEKAKDSLIGYALQQAGDWESYLEEKIEDEAIGIGPIEVNVSPLR